jgi:hypothetical protein
VSAPLKPNICAAQRHVEELTGDYQARVTFQTFIDPKDQALDARILHGSVADCFDELADLNARRHGIFIMVHAGDGRGRTTANVTDLRALFIDDDSGAVGYDDRRLARLPPTLTIASVRGPHHYWRLRSGEDRARFRGAQEQLAAYFGTDSSIKDLPRVMRLAGFFHMRAEPVMVRFVQALNGTRYSIDAVLEAFPAIVPTPKWTAPVAPPRPTAVNAPGRARAWAIRGLENMANELRNCPANGGPDGSRHLLLNRLAYRAGKMVAAGMLTFDEVRDALGRAAESCGICGRDLGRYL